MLRPDLLINEGAKHGSVEQLGTFCREKLPKGKRLLNIMRHIDDIYDQLISVGRLRIPSLPMKVRLYLHTIYLLHQHADYHAI